MGEGCRETLCSSCVHLQVCKLCDTYLMAHNALDGVIITEPYVNDEGKPATRMTYVSNLSDWLTIPTLQCKHYRKDVTVR